MLKYLRQLKHKEENGATMLEAAMVLPFVLFFLFVAIDLFLFAFQAVAVQFVSSNLMRSMTTAETVSTAEAYQALLPLSEQLLLKFNQPKERLESKICLCPTARVKSIESQCFQSNYCVDGGKHGNDSAMPILPGESFFIAIRYPVTQLFSELFPTKKFYVDSVSIGRVEPRGVGS